MNLEKRIDAFARLGEFLGQFQPENILKNDSVLYNDMFFEPFNMQIKRANEFNGWFTKENLYYAFSSWSSELNKSNLTQWTSNYSLHQSQPKNIGIIMAGNIPLVGFHDFLSVLISGNNTVIKQSSTDRHFLPLIAKIFRKG